MRDKLIESAFSWIDTPYHHQARVKGAGVDCAQLMAGIAIDCGLITESIKLPQDYSPEWHLHNREERLVNHLLEFGCIQKSVEDTLPGDIIGFKIGRAVGHLGIMVNETQFIHAQCMVDPQRVVLNTLSADWKKRHTVTFSFPGA